MATPAELAASLTLDEIPVKLRCAACNQLALDAYRTPCCDQSICETCQKSLGPSCPICLHEPVNADDCRPNKALRTTVKAFIKKRGIDKQEAFKKEIANKAPKASGAPASAKNDETSADQASQPSMTPAADAAANTGVSLTSGLQENSETPQALERRLETERKIDGNFSPLEAQKDIARPSIESGNQDPQKQENEDQSTSRNGTAEGADQDEQSMRKSQLPESQQSQEQMPGSSEQQWAAMNGPAQQGMNNGGFGFDGINGGLPNMGFGNVAEINQMMQFMPNAMQNNMMGMFPNMMSMPGMGMDPMTMAQGLYGGFNGQGIGMNGMNAGMGFANGQLAYGGFNGQPASWNGVHNNYNQNAYGGHANGQVGDYGSNAGYGGYNLPQGNFNQMNQRQFSNNDFQHGHHGQGFPNRGRGRGRGYQNYGRGRGGYNQVNSVHQANYEASPSQVPSQLAASQGSSQQQEPNQEQHTDGITRRGSPIYDTETHKSPDDFSKSLDPGDAEDHTQSPNKEQTKEDDNAASDETAEAQLPAEEKPAIDSLTKDEAQEKPSATDTAILPEQNDTESTKHDSATAASVKMPPPPSPVVPTGPAALSSVDHSQFYDHNARGRGRGFYGGSVSSRGGARGRGAGYVPSSGLAHVPNGQHSLVSPVTPIAEPKGLGVEGAPKGPKAMREGLPNTTINGGAKGFSIVGRASAVAQARSSGHTRSRSPSPSRSRSRSPHRSHRHRHHRHRSTDSSYSSDRDRKRERRHRHSRRYEDDDLVDDEESKAADSSSKRSSHRYRDDEKDRESGRSGHRSHRSHRDRSRRRDGDHHSSRKRSRSPATETEKPHVVNGSSHMNGIPPTGPKADRQKAKEEELTSSGRKKREREEDDDHYRERKRSKADFSESGENADDRRATKRAHREDEDRTRTKKTQSLEEKAPAKSEPPTPKSEVDAHTLEREARNRERMQKEMQRRSAMDGKGPGPKRKMSGAGVGQGGRRVSYKYEDEESSEARASRVENEREAGRWG